MLSPFKYAWRTIRRMPGLATVVIVSLGIGIGVNTAIFSWLQLLVLQPLPGVRNSGRFHLVEPRAETGSYPGMSWLEYRDLRERLGSLENLVAFRMTAVNVGEPDRLERTFGSLVSANYFSALGLEPSAGRFFVPDEVARPGGEPVVVVSHDYWQTHLGGRPSAVGETLRVNERALTIVGVTPPGFQGTVIGLNLDLWLPATLAPTLLAGSTELDRREVRGYQAIATLREGASVEDARTEFRGAMERLAREFPQTNKSISGDVLPFWMSPRGPQRFMVSALALLQSVMLLVLLAVCGNTANLVLARASARRTEIGIRMALGARRPQIIGLLLSETLLLGLLGAALGAAVAIWATDALRAMPMTFGFPIRFQTRIDALGVAFAASLGVVCGLVFGLVPALHLSRTSAYGSVRSGSAVQGRSRVRDVLMGVQVALALVVLVIAAIFYRSFRETRELDPGFKKDGVLLAAYDLTGRNVDAAYMRDFAARLVERLSALEGVEAAAIASSVPLDIHGLPLRSFSLEGRARTDGTLDQALTNIVTPRYFEVMRIPLRAGAGFVDLRDAATPAQAVVNEEFVRRFVGEGETIGRSLENGGRRYVISAVVRDSTYESFGERPIPVIYFSYRDRPARQGEIHVRARSGAEASLAPVVRGVMRELDPRLPLYNVRTLTDHIETNLIFRRIPARIFAVLGPLLLLLAAIGIYAVVAYTVSQRTMEIGVRMALGASARRVVAQLVGETLRIVALGLLAGWAIALVIERDFVRGDSMDVSVLVGVPVILLLVATLSCWAPARRAAAIEPVSALRHE
jgi:putative ABC transport system permease protein